MAKEQDEDITNAITESSGRKPMLRFSDDDRKKLKFTFQLPDELIDQIEQRIGKQKGWVDHCLNIPQLNDRGEQ